MVATGWAVITGATTAPPELELLEEEELLDELLLEDDELEEELAPFELPPPDEELLELDELEEELELLLVCVLTDIAVHLAEKLPAESIAATA